MFIYLLWLEYSSGGERKAKNEKKQIYLRKAFFLDFHFPPNRKQDEGERYDMTM